MSATSRRHVLSHRIDAESSTSHPWRRPTRVAAPVLTLSPHADAERFTICADRFTSGHRQFDEHPLGIFDWSVFRQCANRRVTNDGYSIHENNAEEDESEYLFSSHVDSRIS